MAGLRQFKIDHEAHGKSFRVTLTTNYLTIEEDIERIGPNPDGSFMADPYLSDLQKKIASTFALTMTPYRSHTDDGSVLYRLRADSGQTAEQAQRFAAIVRGDEELKLDGWTIRQPQQSHIR